jgi:hypothetical protein
VQVNKFHSINGQAVHNNKNNNNKNSNHAVIPTDHTSSGNQYESNEMQLLTDHLSVLSALQAANQDPQRYYRSMQSGASQDSSASTPALAVGSGTGSSHNNNNNYQGNNNNNVDYKVMDKLLGREQPSSVHGKIIQYSAPPNIPPTQHMMQSAPPNIPYTQQMMQSTPPSNPATQQMMQSSLPNISPTQQMMQSTSPAPVKVPDPATVATRSPYKGNTGSPIVDIQRGDNEDQAVAAADDDRRQQQMQSMTLDDSDLQLDEYDEYEHADSYADDQSVDEDLEDSATGNVLSHRASDGTAKDGRVTASSYAPKPSMNPYMAALYAHSLDDRRPESSQADRPTRMMMQPQQQLSRVRHTRRVRPTRRATADDHHAPTVKRPHKASKLVSKDIAPVKSRSVVSNSKRPAAPHYTSVGRSPINAASNVKSTTVQHAIIIPSPSSAPTNKTTPSVARSNAASPSLSSTRRGSVSPKLYASTASSASKVKATAAVNSSLTSLSFEQPSAKQPGKPDKKLVKVSRSRSHHMSAHELLLVIIIFHS